MQYFVSMENSAYFYWQVDLLIESFKMAGIEDSLVIGIADNENSLKPVKYAKNIIQHPHKIMHKNLGREKGYPPINKIFGLILALQNDIVKSPFALIHPDMILVKPLEVRENVNILFHQGLEDESIKTGILPYLKELAEANQTTVDKFPPDIPLGGTIVFQDVENGFFHRVLTRMIHLAKTLPDAKWDLARGAWTISMYEYLYKYNVKGDIFEKRLIDQASTAPIIHYRRGLPPVFSKRFFGGPNEFKMIGDPYDVLMEITPTDSVAFAQEVVKAYKKPPA